MVRVINNNGISIGTQIKDENDNDIEYITSLRLDFPIDGRVEATITITDVMVEIKANEKYEIMDLKKFPRKYLQLLKEELDKELQCEN